MEIPHAQPSQKDAGAHLQCYTPRRAMKEEQVRYNIHVLFTDFQQILPFQYCSQILHWQYIVNIQMRSCVQQKHTLRLKQICAPSEFVGSRGLAFQAENLEKWKGSPYLVGTRVADENQQFQWLVWQQQEESYPSGQNAGLCFLIQR